MFSLFGLYFVFRARAIRRSFEETRQAARSEPVFPFDAVSRQIERHPEVHVSFLRLVGILSLVASTLLSALLIRRLLQP
jgi:hypothetical protein